MQIGQRLLHLPPVLQHRLGVLGKTVSGFGRQNGAGGAVKKRSAQDSFQLADAAGDDRHGQIVLPRRGGKTVPTIHIEEESQGTQIGILRFH